MHISRESLAEPEDRALLRAVLGTGARPGTEERAPPTPEERFGTTADTRTTRPSVQAVPAPRTSAADR